MRSRSIPFYQTALELWEELGGHVLQRAQVCEQLGDATFKSAIDAQKGLEYFEKSLALYEELGDGRKQAALHSQIGREYGWGGVERRDMDRALEHLHQARVILEGLPDSVALGLVYNTLGTGNLSQFRVGQALEWYEKGAAVAERLQSPPLLSEAAQYPAQGFFQTGRISAAKELLDRSWQMAARHQLAYQGDNCRSMGARLGVLLKHPRFGMSWAERIPSFQTTAVIGITEEVAAFWGSCPWSASST